MSSLIWVMGLPIDVTPVDGMLHEIRTAARDGRRLIFATANLNFLRLAGTDTEFADAIRRCDRVVADGTPVLWLARLLGTRLPERVSGSGIVEALTADTSSEPIETAFFGGPPGAAELAVERTAGGRQGIRGVAAIDPGYVPLEELGDAGYIDRLNASAASFIVVALGARKGHLWIDQNQDRLHAPVISHLGAVVNFLAGTLKRAPPRWQRLGLEWLWRTIQEPVLARRYAQDAYFLLRVVIRILAFSLSERLDRGAREGPSSLEVDRRSHAVVALSGALTDRTCTTLQRFLDDHPDVGFQIDLSALTRLDATGIGSLFAARARRRVPCSITPVPQPVLAILRRHRAEGLIDVRAPADARGVNG